jgi:hypothetical protein
MLAATDPTALAAQSVQSATVPPDVLGNNVVWGAVSAAGALATETAAGKDPSVQAMREWRVQADLLREIFGNPFRPVPFDAAWRTPTAVALAGQMYESRDFSAMPILADALQDAVCDSDDILGHCRGPGPHVRGCWVVDLVLGKA